MGGGWSGSSNFVEGVFGAFWEGTFGFSELGVVEGRYVSDE